MEVHRSEGVANHTVPESCGARREACVEALTGEHTGQPLSRESLPRGADAVESAEGNMDGGVSASRRPTPRGLRPWHVRTLLAREPGDLAAGHRREPTGPHREGDEPKPMMHGCEKSDRCIVPAKSPNNPGCTGQRRGWREGTWSRGRRTRAHPTDTVPTGGGQTSSRGDAAKLHGLPRPRTSRHYHPRQEPGAGIPHAGICAGGAQ